MRINYNDLIGVPFEEMNCWQLVQEIYSRHGISLQDYNIGVDECQRISKIYAKELDQDTPGFWKRLYTPEPLALVAIRNHPKYISHCGVSLGSGQFIHSLYGIGVIISKIRDPNWQFKIAGFYQYVG